MNRIDFKSSGGFPLTTNTLDLLQTTYRLAVDALVQLGGDDYILWGCTEKNGQVGNGAIVHKGELLEFRGGTKQTYFIVKEIKESGKFEDGVDKNIYYKRWAQFGTGVGQTPWTSLKRIDNIQSLTNELNTHTHAWAKITEKPAYATRWPKWNEVTAKPKTFPPSSHSHPWNQVTGKPVQAVRWPKWNEVTGKPASFPVTGHKHSWGQITGEPAQAVRWPFWHEILGRPRIISGRISVHGYRLSGTGFTCKKISGARFLIVHNLNTTAYSFVGSGYNKDNIKASMYEPHYKWCKVAVSDDASLNDEGFTFIIVAH